MNLLTLGTHAFFTKEHILMNNTDYKAVFNLKSPFVFLILHKFAFILMLKPNQAINYFKEDS